MTTAGNEVCLTELEVAILSSFVTKKILNNDTVIKTLEDLITKLRK